MHSWITLREVVTFSIIRGRENARFVGEGKRLVGRWLRMKTQYESILSLSLIKCIFIYKIMLASPPNI